MCNKSMKRISSTVLLNVYLEIIIIFDCEWHGASLQLLLIKNNHMMPYETLHAEYIFTLL